jgi:hypothetical protein
LQGVRVAVAVAGQMACTLVQEVDRLSMAAPVTGGPESKSAGARAPTVGQ